MQFLLRLKEKLIIIAFLLFSAHIASAQTYKLFINKYGDNVDSVKADGYILFNQLADSIWAIRRFGMNDTIIMSGSYKDKTLSIPHGKFTYYYKQSFKNARFSQKPSDSFLADTFNYVSSVGYFENGVKVGRWTDYYSNGNKRYVRSFVKGKLNGPYQSYNYDANAMLIRGDFINDKREGEWDILDTKGNLIQKDFYKNGKISKSIVTPATYQEPEPLNDFYHYINYNVGKLTDRNTSGEIKIVCDITENGKLFNPSIIGDGITPEFNNKVLTLIPEMPVWKPAYDTALKKNIKDHIVFSVKIENGKIEMAYLNSGAVLFHQMQSQ